MLCTSVVSFIKTWQKLRSGLEGKEAYTVHVNGQFVSLVCRLLHLCLNTVKYFMFLGLQYF